MTRFPYRTALAFAALALPLAPARAGDPADPFADAILAYFPGDNPAAGYTDPTTALGPPERFTGEGIFPSAVTAFNPAFGVDEIVSIGAGGFLELQFDAPIVDDPCNPFGIDLIVFGNSGFLDASFPDGIVGGIFTDGGDIEVSDTGLVWYPVPDAEADGMYPTIGYLDAGPFDVEPGAAPSNFTRPVDPALTLSDFMGMTNDEVIAAYACSGGGFGIDIGALGLDSVQFVRISNPFDAQLNVEIDAVADVSALGDVNADGVVGPADLALLLGGWGPVAPGHGADLDCDGVVGPTDLATLLGCWGG